MKYTFEQINDICKQPERVELLFEQNDILRKELGEQMKRIITLEKTVMELGAIVNELNLNTYL